MKHHPGSGAQALMGAGAADGSEDGAGRSGNAAGAGASGEAGGGEDAGSGPGGGGGELSIGGDELAAEGFGEDGLGEFSLFTGGRTLRIIQPMKHYDIRLVSVAVCLLLVTMSGCSGTSESDLVESTSPIVGGTAAAQSQIHSAVALVKAADGTLFCSGTLIAPSVVVTAAHCVVDYNDATRQITAERTTSEIVVVAGTLDATTTTTDQRYAIASIVRHGSFPGPVSVDPAGLAEEADLGLLLLQKPINSLSLVPTLPFDQFDSKLTMGTLVAIEGYGDRDSLGMLEGQLYLAETPYQRRNETEFIAGAPGSPDTCTRDSGGPVYLSVGGTMYLVGVTSRDAGGPCGDGGIYTIVSRYEGWLHDNSVGAYPPEADRDGGADGGSNGPSALLPGCSCRLERAPSSTGPSLWTSLGIAVLVARRRRR